MDEQQSKYRHHSNYIDEFDMRRIFNKTVMLKKVIKWLEHLKELDSTIDKAEIDEAIEQLQNKATKLDTKFNQAREDMCEEAELLSNLYLDED